MGGLIAKSDLFKTNLGWISKETTILQGPDSAITMVPQWSASGRPVVDQWLHYGKFVRNSTIVDYQTCQKLVILTTCWPLWDRWSTIVTPLQ